MKLSSRPRKTAPPAPAEAHPVQADQPKDDSRLFDLVRLRSGQLHHSSTCICTYLDRLRNLGEPWERLCELNRWSQAACFDAREKAALALCDAIGRHAEPHRLEVLLKRALHFFSPDEISRLVLCILAVDDLNELCSFT